MKHLSEETKAKLREANTGNKNPMYGVRLTGEKNGMFGKHHSDESKIKMSGSHNPMFGKHHTEETKAKMRGRKPWNLGKHMSEEAKAKSRAKKLGKHPSIEARIKMSEAHMKGRLPTQKTGRKRAEKLFPCPKGLERHHIDGNALNNTTENIAFVTRKEHARLDGRIAKANKARLEH